MGEVRFNRCFALSLAAMLCAQPSKAGDSLPVKISEAWIRAVPPSLTDTAAFMRIENTSDAPLRLTGGNTPLAGMVMPMETTRKIEHGVEVLGMRGVDFLEIPAHGERLLKPGGDHLMLMTLKSHPAVGATIPITLDFEPDHRTITVKLTVRIDN